MSDGSQYQEATFILKHFKGRDPATLRFLDIGAFDGVTFSNTKPLADLGWFGVCVEPSPPAFCWLMKAYEGNPRVQLVNAALVPAQLREYNTGPIPRLRQLHCNTADAYSADMMSTFDAAHRDKFAAHPFRDIWTPVIDWQELGPLCRTGFNFVNIDVEGANAGVLECMPWSPEMICVEWDKGVDGSRPLDILARRGYKTHEIGGNLLGWMA